MPSPMDPHSPWGRNYSFNQKSEPWDLRTVGAGVAVASLWVLVFGGMMGFRMWLQVAAAVALAVVILLWFVLPNPKDKKK